MFRNIFFAGLFIFSVSSLPAQHSDELISDDGNFNAIHNGLDERNIDDYDFDRSFPVAILQSLPVYKNKYTRISRVVTGHRKGLIIGSLAGKELFSTEYKRNNFHGTWKSRYTNGQLIDSGSFNTNLPDGQWISWYRDGKIRSIRNYSSAKWFAVRREVRNRSQKIYYQPLSGKVGFSSAAFEKYTSAAASFASLSNPDGKPYEPPFKFCLHHGLYMNFYPNGAVKDSGYYKDGMKDGLWKEFYPNGEVSASGSYYRGHKNSGWTYFNRKGQLTMLAEYKNGKLTFKKTYEGIVP